MSVWPAQFQLLSKTKQFAAESPLPSGLPHELAKFELPNYFVEPGDRILIEPVDLDSEIGSLGDQKIQLDGSVDLGKFGRIRVTGMTVEEIEQVVESQIAMYVEGETMNVQLVESNAAEVYVIGEVGSPAAYPIDGHEHVLDAILRAGGLTSKASPCDIILVRPTTPESCRVVLPVCYRQITQLGDVTTNYQLQPGDRVVVGSRGFWEELAFWKQKKDCNCCDRSGCVECQPSTVQYQNHFAGQQQPFAHPAEHPAPQPAQRPTQQTGQNVNDVPEPTQADLRDLLQPNTNESTSKPETQPDEDFFLPSPMPDEIRK